MTEVSLRTRIYKSNIQSTSPKIKLIASISNDSYFAISKENALYYCFVTKFHEWNGKTTKNPFIPLATPMDVSHTLVHQFNECIADMNWSSLRKHLCLCDASGKVSIFNTSDLQTFASSLRDHEVVSHVEDMDVSEDRVNSVLPENQMEREELNESEMSHDVDKISEDSHERKRRRIHSPMKFYSAVLPKIQFSLSRDSREPENAKVSMYDSWNNDSDSQLIAVSRDCSSDVHIYQVKKGQSNLLKYIPCNQWVIDLKFVPPVDLSIPDVNPGSPLLVYLEYDSVVVWDISKMEEVTSYRPTSGSNILYGLNHFFRNQIPQIGTVGEDRSVIVYDTRKYCAQSTWKQCMKYAPGGIFFSREHKDICYIFGRDSQELKASNFVSTKKVKRNTSMFSSTRWSDMDFLQIPNITNYSNISEILMGCNEAGEVYIIINPEGMYGKD